MVTRSLLFVAPVVWIFSVYGMERPGEECCYDQVYPVSFCATNEDLVKAYSLDFTKFKMSKELFKENKSDSIQFLTQLANKGDIPSKYILSDYYLSKKKRCFSKKQKSTFRKKKELAQEWQKEAFGANYPPAVFDYGVKVCNEGKFVIGLWYIGMAAIGSMVRVEFPDNKQQIYLPYYYMPAVEFLKNYYFEYYPDGQLAIQWNQFYEFLKKSKNGERS